MRWLFNVLKAVALLAVVLSAIGFALPDQRQISRSIDVAAPPSRVWALVADPRRWSEWSPWFARDPAMVVQFAGAASGTGAQWQWESAVQGRGHMRFDDAVEPQRLSYTLQFDDWAPSRGEFVFESIGPSATRVTWRLEARFGLNPVARWFGLALDRMVGPDFEKGLARLADQAAGR